MGATTRVPVAEYLSTVYRPDMDYVDGVLEDRNVGEKPHSRLQGQLIYRLMSSGFQFTYPELRLQVSPTRYRIPDVCVYLEEPKEDVPTVPPALAIEILSPEDRMSQIHEKLDDYRRMGCPCVWIIDPARKRGFESVGTAFNETEQLTHPSIASLRVVVSELL